MDIADIQAEVRKRLRPNIHKLSLFMERAALGNLLPWPTYLT
jgi:hypothetical protein